MPEQIEPSIYDPTQVRPRRDFVSVLEDERKGKLDSGLFLPSAETGPEKVTEGTGTLLRIGTGEKTRKMGIEPGMRIVFRAYLKYANPIESEEKWPSGEKKRYFLMSCEDVFAIIPPGLDVGVFSGRPQVPETK